MAAPHPEDELERVRRLASKGLPALSIVTGPNDFFRAEAVALLLAAVPKDAELRSIDAVDERAGGDGGAAEGDEGSDEADQAPEADADAAEGLARCPELLDLRGGGRFARSAFVFVRRGKNWWKTHVVTLATQLPKFAKGCGLVVEASKVDKRKKVAATLVKELAQAGAVFEFRDLYETPFGQSNPLQGELCKWVAGRSKKLGVALTPEAAWLVVMQVGKALPELLAELGRLRDQLGADPASKPLLPADLRGKLTCSFESNPFEFAEAVLGGDRRAALRSVRAMFDRGVRGKDGRAMDTGGLLPFATSWLFQSLARTHEARLLLDSGVSPRDLPARAGVYNFADRFIAQVQQNDRARLRTGLLALHHCQRASRLTGEDPELLLERFLAQWFDGAPIPAAEDLDL